MVRRTCFASPFYRWETRITGLGKRDYSYATVFLPSSFR